MLKPPCIQYSLYIFHPLMVLFFICLITSFFTLTLLFLFHIFLFLPSSLFLFRLLARDGGDGERCSNNQCFIVSSILLQNDDEMRRCGFC
jgi:hypothetical protein